MILAGTIIAGILAAWLLLAGWIAHGWKVTFRQAFLLVPFKVLWRLEARKLARVSEQKSTIFVVSHQSCVDPAIMLGLLPPDTLHILDEVSAGTVWLEPWRELARTITFNPEHLFISRRLVRILRGGGRLCVYMPADVEPDTRTFRLFRAVARTALRAEAKIVTVHIDGAANSPFSLAPRAETPRRLFPRLRISALEPMTVPELLARSGPAAGRNASALFDRLAEARFSSTPEDRTLFKGLAHAARLHGSAAPVIEDATGARLSYSLLMTSVRALADKFASRGATGDAFGVLLPNAATTAVTFFALQSAGRVAAMLNYTAGPANIAAAIRLADLRLVVSSRAFVEKAQLADEIEAIEASGARMVWLEDLRDGISSFDKAVAYLNRMRPVISTRADEPAVLLFTSGSEGTPKGVVLSHRNLVANTAQLETRITFTPLDTLFNVLPVFHAFGLTGGMVLPLLYGVRLYLYLSPLHYKQIPETAAKVRPTILLGTDTFLAAYARTAQDEDFASLRLVISGAEPVRAQTREIWRERFGAEIVEGYGMTEASPVVAVNSATHGKPGTVGRPLPGMQVRVEPVEGLEEGGVLLVKGPNVMLGYRTLETGNSLIAPPGGWHDSGDVVTFDREGYLVIRGRMRRFAKVAGEMVSLGAVEMLAHALWPEDKHAAVALPDERKGERIVLVTTATDADRNELRAHARHSGASELALPAAVVSVEDIPVLGSGKIDHAAVRRLAEDAQGIGRAA